MRRALVILPGFVITDGNDHAPLLQKLGVKSIERRGVIDPHISNGSIKYYADLSISGGPKLGPFDTKNEAVQSEIDYLLSERFKEESYSR
jgi:hypothetical protein